MNREHRRRGGGERRGIIIGVVLGFLRECLCGSTHARDLRRLCSRLSAHSVFKRLPFTFKEVSDQDGENDGGGEDEGRPDRLYRGSRGWMPDDHMLDEFLNTEQGLDLHPELTRACCITTRAPQAPPIASARGYAAGVDRAGIVRGRGE